MKTYPLAAALLAIAFCAHAAEADPKQTPLEHYRSETNFNVTLCGLKYKLALEKAKAASMGVPDAEKQDEKSDFNGCIRQAKADGKASLDKAMKTVKKPAAREALKTYHVAFIATIDGVRAGDNEMRMHYDQRQNALKARMDDAWARFDIEQ